MRKKKTLTPFENSKIPSKNLSSRISRFFRGEKGLKIVFRCSISRISSRSHRRHGPLAPEKMFFRDKMIFPPLRMCWCSPRGIHGRGRGAETGAASLRSVILPSMSNLEKTWNCVKKSFCSFSFFFFN